MIGDAGLPIAACIASGEIEFYPAGCRCMCRTQFRKTRALQPIRGENTNPLGQFASPVDPQGGVVISLTVTVDARDPSRRCLSENTEAGSITTYTFAPLRCRP